MWGDSFLIVFISVCTALLGEGLTYLLVYRTEKYQKLKGEVEKQSKKCKTILQVKFNLLLVLFPISFSGKAKRVSRGPACKATEKEDREG